MIKTENLLETIEVVASLKEVPQSWNKVLGDIRAGAQVEIRWDENYDHSVDFGYLFRLPESNRNDETDFLVHIESPSLSRDEVFIHLLDLVDINFIREIKAV